MGLHAGSLISRVFQCKVECSQADQFFMLKPQLSPNPFFSVLESKVLFTKIRSILMRSVRRLRYL